MSAILGTIKSFRYQYKPIHFSTEYFRWSFSSLTQNKLSIFTVAIQGFQQKVHKPGLRACLPPQGGQGVQADPVYIGGKNVYKKTETEMNKKPTQICVL